MENGNLTRSKAVQLDSPPMDPDHQIPFNDSENQYQTENSLNAASLNADIESLHIVEFPGKDREDSEKKQYMVCVNLVHVCNLQYRFVLCHILAGSCHFSRTKRIATWKMNSQMNRVLLVEACSCALVIFIPVGSLFVGLLLKLNIVGFGISMTMVFVWIRLLNPRSNMTKNFTLLTYLLIGALLDYQVISADHFDEAANNLLTQITQLRELQNIHQQHQQHVTLQNQVKKCGGDCELSCDSNSSAAE
ncbi:hypothetical protein DdX_20475 [Ditylenchus destructor]|uniref:Uncharacterized protein n=1 Tax=Ditylenchus destructor TaxID=166010 RepID=A0AAD4MGA8_9BILA|nr:hypothetical protein DdX_20475 [Ditylenchus destructor]